MPAPLTPATPTHVPGPASLPVRNEPKAAPYDGASSYGGRLARLRALESDKKR
jgi:hypothetical protein